MDPQHANELHLSISHHFDDESDTFAKSKIKCFLTDPRMSAQSTAYDISKKFEAGQDYPTGFLNQVEDNFIFMSTLIPASHPAQDRLLDLVKAMRGLPEHGGEPLWQDFLAGDGMMSLVEAYHGTLIRTCLFFVNSTKRRYRWS
jgi:hypothetical protein